MTLTQTAILTKRLLIFGIITLIVVAIAWGSYTFYVASQPKPPPPIDLPTVKFGVLPRPLLPEASTSASNYNFFLDTDTGNLPSDLPSNLNVYLAPQLGATLLAADRVKEVARRFGFTEGPQILSSSQHRFTDGLGGQITINLDTGNFVLEHPEASPTADLIARPIDEQSLIASDFKGYLSGRGQIKPGINNGEIKVTYNASSPGESTGAFISLFPNNINDLKVVTPTFNTGLINAIFSKFGRNDAQYTKINYTYWEPDETTASTYPLKSVQTAYDELKNNQGVIIVPPKSNRASITKIYLAYYEPEEYPTYIQPVYVFEGPDFVGYVPAINDDYLAK